MKCMQPVTCKPAMASELICRFVNHLLHLYIPIVKYICNNKILLDQHLLKLKKLTYDPVYAFNTNENNYKSHHFLHRIYFSYPCHNDPDGM